MSRPDPVHPLADPLGPLPALLVKEGLALGRLADPQRQLCLGLVWSGLPEGVLTEREVNEVLKASLTGTAAFLAADHVELRRWLVDAGWLARDGYGRAYTRVDIEQLPAPARPLAAAFRAIDVAGLAARVRDADDARRAARRQAWQARERGGRAP